MRSLTCITACALFAFAPLTAVRADFAMPPLGHIVTQAETIVEGRFRTDGAQVTFEVSRSLRGDVAAGRVFSLGHPGGPLAFDLRRFLAVSSPEGDVLLLGRAQGDRFELSWLNFSVWPQGVGQRWAFLRDRAASLAFITAVTEYDALARGGEEAWVGRIVADLDRPDLLPALLAHLQSAPRVLQGNRPLEQQVLGIVAARVAASGRADEWTVQSMASLGPDMPQSITLPYFAEIARGESLAGELARQQIASSLRIRGLLPEESPRDAGALAKALPDALPRLRTADLRKYAPIASAASPRIQGEALSVYRGITGEAGLRSLPAAELQQLWSEAASK